MSHYTDEEKKESYIPGGEEGQQGADFYGESTSDVTVVFAKLKEAENSHDIKLRTMSWQKTAALLFGDQVCLAIMAQAWSFSVLGWVPALITSILSGLMFWLTSITMWRFMMKHPQVRDVCDLGRLLFGNSALAYEATGFMLLANNILLIGFHTLTFTRILQTLADGSSVCSVWFSFIGTIIGVIASLPRTLKHVSYMSIFSASCMGIAILTFLIFVGIEDHPSSGYGGKYPALGEVYTYAFPRDGTTWVDCLNAVLNITFLWVPQILFPTFINEMERPQDFPKALAALAILSFVLFLVVPIVGFRYLGQYAKAPSFGSLLEHYKKGSFAFVIVPTVVIAVIYANVSAKFIYSRIMRGSRHEHSNTVIGWGAWVGVLSFIWGLAFVFAEVVPSMGDFLSLLGAAFDSFFGAIFWSVAYYHIYKSQFFTTTRRSINTVLHIIIFFIGLFLLGPGLYAAVEAIIADYAGGTSGAFSCSDYSI
ncbi:transmembrane amino acid transporter protein-domain-containing protein [Naematelia encephala]|uniref:Transmembrane amino acid transporter protein-domain-containing protein n=1 Tax=Naematelia encephala TaxID=71784 RepID=A0A1Y2AZ73_9TREE|nr:transmembrane amino acid transporter protein-domain-containing protein [Naematelia encephala]